MELISSIINGFLNTTAHKRLWQIMGAICCLLLVVTACNQQRIKDADNVPHKNLSANQEELVPLFKSGEAGYACFRIPAIVKTTNGFLLAFCEARKNGCSDTGDIDMVMKKSEDDGESWSELKVIWDDGKNVCGNPAPVVDTETGQIHLLATWNNGNDKESEIIEGTSIEGREVFHLISNDDGVSWSIPNNISGSVKLPDWTWYATGPVHGIQLKHEPYSGRLVIPCDHIEKESKKYYSHTIYSDDHGVSWKLGGTTPNDQVNECTVVELSDGHLMLNMRNYARKRSQTRQVALSSDGGATWAEQRFDNQLPEPRCQGALITVDKNGKQLLLFTNPADSESRVNMTLSLSKDQGINWYRKIPGSVYDMACGIGRHSILLAQKGFSVFSIDISDVALTTLKEYSIKNNLDIKTRLLDLTLKKSFRNLPKVDNIVAINYKVHDDLLDMIPSLLSENGIFLYYTFNLKHSQTRNFRKEYCLKPNELVDRNWDLKLLKYAAFQNESGHHDGYLFQKL